MSLFKRELNDAQREALGFVLGFASMSAFRKGPAFYTVARKRMELLLPLLSFADRAMMKYILDADDPFKASEEFLPPDFLGEKRSGRS